MIMIYVEFQKNSYILIIYLKLYTEINYKNELLMFIERNKISKEFPLMEPLLFYILNYSL